MQGQSRLNARALAQNLQEQARLDWGENSICLGVFKIRETDRTMSILEHIQEVNPLKGKPFGLNSCFNCCALEAGYRLASSLRSIFQKYREPRMDTSVLGKEPSQTRKGLQRDLSNHFWGWIKWWSTSSFEQFRWSVGHLVRKRMHTCYQPM